MSPELLKAWLSLGSIVVLLLGCLLSCSSGTSTLSELPSCVGTVYFTTSPIDLDDLAGLVPLGHLNPTGHVFPSDHIYFYIRQQDADDSQSDAIETSLYAPGAVTITSITATEHLSVEPPTTDYRIVFSPCRELQGYFGHVQSLDASVEEALGTMGEDDCESYSTGGETYRSCSKSVSFAVAAGERIGTAGGAGQRALDFGLHDSRVEALPYANPDRYDVSDDGFNSFHVVCPVDYYEDSVRETLEEEFGSFDGTSARSAAPLCGTVEQDEPGTAQGNWFVQGTTKSLPEDPHLALVHDNVDPAIAVFSVGTSMENLSSGKYTFTPSDSDLVNRDFDQVTSDGNIYCYENLTDGLMVLLQLTSDTSLRIEAQSATSCGSGPWFFGSSYSDFER